MISAFLFRALDPQAPRKRYSWEVEEETGAARERDTLEPSSPDEVPVLWKRDAPDDGDRPGQGKVLPFPQRGRTPAE